MNRKTNMIWLCISITGFLGMAISFLLMPNDTTNIIPGAMFWGCFILGIVAQIILNSRTKRGRGRGKIGLICFVRNIPAIVADIICLVSLIAFGVAVITTKGIGFTCYIFLAVCVFAFCLHCIFNGKIYQYIAVKREEG